MANPRFTTVREAVINAYPGEYWRMRVLRMSSSQVYAIYHSLKRRKPKALESKDTDIYTQMTIYDYFNEKGEVDYEQVNG